MKGTHFNFNTVAVHKWRLIFAAFAIVYAIILLANITRWPIQWDEVTHLNEANFLYWGLYQKFLLNAFYPPLFDGIIWVSFEVFGVHLFAARIIPVLFSILSLWVTFELTQRMYGGKTAMLSVGLLSVMPGYFWLSQSALLESALVFFTLTSFLFFYRWLTTRQDKMLVLTGIMVGLGFLTKYQALVALVVFVFSILFLARDRLKWAFKKFTLTIVAAVLVVVPWALVAYQVYADHILEQWLYALQVGNPERSIYSDRFFQPIFYLVDMVWPYDTIHPISIFIYIAGFAGLICLAWRRKPQDKYLLIWFIVIYVFFTLISNRAWRYVLPLFPAIAISAAVVFWGAFGRLQRGWQRGVGSVGRKRFYKVAGVLLVVALAGSVAVSIYDSYVYVKNYDIDIQIEEATNYAYYNMDVNKSIIVLCPFDMFDREMVRFYLWQDGDNKIPVFQYPRLAVDAYAPDFNITEFIQICNITQVQYVFTYEYGGTVNYYNSSLNLQQIYAQLYDSGNFTHINPNTTFGENPRRIFILEFIG